MQSLKISKETLKKMKGLSKIIYIVSRVVWIFMTVATFLVAIIGLLVVLVWGNIELFNADGTFTQSGQIFDNTITNNFMNTYDGDIEQVAKAKEFAYDLVSEEKRESFLIIISIFFIGAVIQMGLLVFLFMKLDKLFMNISTESTPFNKENPIIIRVLGFGLLAYVVIEWLFSCIGNRILSLDGAFKFNINLYLLGLIFIIFAISYVFNYAYELQKNYVRVAKELEGSDENA